MVKATRAEEMLQLLVPAAALVAYALLALHVDDPVRASSVDRLILHNTDETFRYHHIRHALTDPALLLSSYARPVYTAIAALFHAVLPGEMLSLRLMNALLSAGALWLVLLLGRRLGLAPWQGMLAALVTAFSPTYLLHSVSVQATPMAAAALLGSLYLLMTKRLAASTLLAGLLPLIRPEGTVSLLLWGVFILRARGLKGLRLLALLLAPMAAFVLLNRLVLGPGVMERVQYHAVLLSLGMFGENPFRNLDLDLAVLARPLANYLRCMGPLVAAPALAGLIMLLRRRQAHDRPLLAVTGLYFAFYALFTLPIGFGLEKMSAWGHLEYAAAPITPLIGLLAVVPLRAATRYPVPVRAMVIILVALAAIIPSVLILNARRNDYRFHWRPAVNAAQLKDMQKAANWLAGEANAGGVHTLYLSAEDGASGLTNMFLPHLPDTVGYRLLLRPKGEALQALDMGTFTFGPPRPARAVYLSTGAGPAHLGPQLGARLLKSFDAAGLHFYALPSHSLTPGNKARP